MLLNCLIIKRVRANGFSNTDPLPPPPQHIIYHITYPQTAVHAVDRLLTILPCLPFIDVYIVRVNTLLLGGTPGQVYQGPDQEIGPASVRVAHVLVCPVPCTSNMTTRFTQEVNLIGSGTQRIEVKVYKYTRTIDWWGFKDI